MGDNRWLGSVPIYNHLPTTLPSFSPQYSPLQDNSIEMVALIAREGWGGGCSKTQLWVQRKHLLYDIQAPSSDLHMKLLVTKKNLRLEIDALFCSKAKLFKPKISFIIERHSVIVFLLQFLDFKSKFNRGLIHMTETRVCLPFASSLF